MGEREDVDGIVNVLNQIAKPPLVDSLPPTVKINHMSQINYKELNTAPEIIWS